MSDSEAFETFPLLIDRSQWPAPQPGFELARLPFYEWQGATLVIEKVTAQLAGEIAPGWQVVQPLEVVQEKCQSGYVFKSKQLDFDGEGKTPIEALLDYVLLLVKHYQIFEEKARQGDPEAQAKFSQMQAYLQPHGVENEPELTLQTLRAWAEGK